MSSSIDRDSGTAQTVGATTAILASFAMPDNSAGHISGSISGRTAGGLAVAATVFSDGALAAWSAAFVVNGSRVDMRVTGVAGQTIDWFGEMFTHLQAQ